MSKNHVLDAIAEMRKISKKRNFAQTIELLFSFKNLDLKKQENSINLRVSLPYSTGKGKAKSIAFIKDKHFADQIKGIVDKVVLESEIEELSKNKKELNQMIEEYDVWVAEGPVMLTVGKFLGQQLAPKNKMPKPVITDLKQVEQIVSSASTSTSITNKKGKLMPYIHMVIGKEDMKDEQLGENINMVIESITNVLPQKKQNLKCVYIKETMGPPVKIIIEGGS